MRTKEEILAAVKRAGVNLAFAEFQDKEIILEAVNQDGWALQYSKFQDKEIILAAVNNLGSALAYAKFQDREIVKAALFSWLSYRFIDKSLLDHYIKGSKHDVLALDGIVAIGCQVHPLSYWLKNYKRIGARYGYSDEEIDEYYGYLERIKAK